MNYLKKAISITLFLALAIFSEASAQLTVHNLTGCNLQGRAVYQVPGTCLNIPQGAVINSPAGSVTVYPIPVGLTTHFVMIYQGAPWSLVYVSDGCAFPNIAVMNPLVGCVAVPTNVQISVNDVRIWQ